MISYQDVPTLDDATRAEVDALLERSTTIADMPEDHTQVEAWERLAADCDRVGFPHLTATARISQFFLLSQGGHTPEAITAFVRLMQLISRHRSLIDPRKTELVLGSIVSAVATGLDDPTMPLARIEKMVDLVDAEVRLQGTDRAGVYLARATVQAARGDAYGTREWLERYRAEGSPDWHPHDPAVLQIDVPLFECFDPAEADAVLLRGARSSGYELDAALPVVNDDSIKLLVLHAYLLRRQQRHAEADRIAQMLIAHIDPGELAQSVPPEQLVPVLENHAEAALIAVDVALSQLTFTGSSWQVVAAAARDRLRADPAGLEGRLLRRLAEEAAAAHDDRGGTTVHSRDLQEFWWSGLPSADAGPDNPSQPDNLSDPDHWAELILTAGWLDRAGWLSLNDAPVALKPRYVTLLHDSFELVEAEDPTQAEAQMQQLRAEAQRLHCATNWVNLALLGATQAAERGDNSAVIDAWLTAQQAFCEASSKVADFVTHMLEGIFVITLELAVADPSVSWQQIDELIAAKCRVVHETGCTPAATILLARLEIAAHRGRGDQVRSIGAEAAEAIAAEGRWVDTVGLGLSVVRLTAEHAPDIAEALARKAVAEGDEVQVRAGAAWLSWFAYQRGLPRAAELMPPIRDEILGDVEDLGPLPAWVVLDVLAHQGEELKPVVEGVLFQAQPLTADKLPLLVTAGAWLRRCLPDDPRGPEFQQRARAIVRGLDERNGDTRWTQWLQAREAGLR